MKKILLLMLVFALALTGLSGCKKPAGQDDGSSTLSDSSDIDTADEPNLPDLPDDEIPDESIGENTASTTSTASKKPSVSTASKAASVATLPSNLTKQDKDLFPKRNLGSNKNIVVYSSSAPNDWLIAAAQVYKAKYGGTVTYQIVSWDMRNTRLRQYIQSGDSPDFMPAYGVDIITLMYGDLLTPLDDKIDMKNKNLAIDIMKTRSTYKNKTYGFAPKSDDGTDQAPLLMLFNNALFKKAALKTPLQYYNENKWTWETFKKLATDITEKDGSGATTVFGAASWQDEAFVISNGISPAQYKNDTVSINVGDAKARQAFDLIHDLVASGSMVSDRWAGGALFNSGKVAMYHGYVNDWGQLKKNGMDVDFVPFPKGPAADKHYALGDFSVYSIPKGAKNVQGGLAFAEILANGFPNLSREKRPFSGTQEKRYIDYAKNVLDGGHILSNSGPLGAEWNTLVYDVRLQPVGTALEGNLPKLTATLNTFLSTRK